ncbi:MAG: universal stress protein [Acidimicrobiales bacterium]|nr:universal stress protein [Acidimicrobiales bacterium]
MTAPALLCADGSATSTAALAAGLELLGRDTALALVTVVEDPDPMLVSGTGFAGGVMTPDALDEMTAAAMTGGREVLDMTAQTLGLDDVDTYVLRGDAATAICQLAEEVGARAIVIGSRGHSGFRRAVLGSVSDHVVRNAPCPVVVTGQHASA